MTVKTLTNQIKPINRRMKMKRSTIIYAMAALALTACSNDENLDNLNGPVEIRLTSGLEVQTRATHGLDDKLKNGEKVHVWVDDAKSSSELYLNNTLTADNNGTLTGGTTMYFPETGNAVDIYAIHGNLTANADLTDFWGTEQSHTVAENQKSDVNGYAQSDLVYAKSEDVARNGNPTTVNLTFEHLLSKVEVVLVQGEGSPSIANMEILNTQLEAKFTPSKTENFAVKASEASNPSNPIVIDTDLTSETDAEGTDESKKKLNEAIIVPQALTAGTEFIRVTTTAGGTLVYKIPDGGKTFDKGKKYRYTVTANLTGLEVTATITPWTPETGDDNGVAEME